MGPQDVPFILGIISMRRILGHLDVTVQNLPVMICIDSHHILIVMYSPFMKALHDLTFNHFTLHDFAFDHFALSDDSRLRGFND